MNKYYDIVFSILTRLWFWSVRIATLNSEYGLQLYLSFCKHVTLRHNEHLKQEEGINEHKQK